MNGEIVEFFATPYKEKKSTITVKEKNDKGTGYRLYIRRRAKDKKSREIHFMEWNGFQWVEFVIYSIGYVHRGDFVFECLTDCGHTDCCFEYIKQQKKKGHLLLLK